ncbi:MAG: hypothetical protein DMG05_15195 [Acidobacteria bacterium]|nr:MAG: hypothetical protein DMG05_15195 [Acidobacteriota bacterium]
MDFPYNLVLQLGQLAGRDRRVFEQLDDPKLAGRKSWKERHSERVIILVVLALFIGTLVYRDQFPVSDYTSNEFEWRTASGHAERGSPYCSLAIVIVCCRNPKPCVG